MSAQNGESGVEQTFLSAHPFRSVDPEAVHRARRRLPHWHQPNRIYFITFRLADSVAQEKLTQWKEEAALLSVETERNRLCLKRQQAWLDKGMGSCLFKTPYISAMVEQALLHFDRERYLLGDYVIMPNHVHLIVQPLESYSLSEIIKSWKGYSSREINLGCGTSGSLWMDEYFDHMIRNESYFEKFQDYIRENPIKAELGEVAFRLGCGALQMDGQTGMSAPHGDGAEIGQTGMSAPQPGESDVEQTFLSAQIKEVGLLLSASRRIHMLGVGGIGMAGLAFLLKQRGHIVSGSDAQENRQTAWLRDKGISIQDEVPAGVEWIIRSRAVPNSHSDVVAAKVPVSWRGEVLPVLLRDRFTIAVSGTHGKTTTASMIAQILDCGYCIGGEVVGFDGVARDGEIMVVEADESDGTVANYHPDIAVITNVEYDHMEHHDSAEAFEGCFKTFIANTKEKIIYCADDPAAVRLCAEVENAVPYGLQVSNFKFQVSLPGRHNRLNAMAAVAVSKHWKTVDEIRVVLAGLKPIKRRFEIVFDGEYKVISDYAHHPTEIRALIDAALETLKPKRLLGVFQPHRYTRTLALGPDFPPAFQGLEKLWLLPVYAASEKPLEGGMTDDLIGHFNAVGVINSKDRNNRIKSFQTLENAWEEIHSELRAGDALLIIGAGDIEQLAEWARGGEE